MKTDKKLIVIPDFMIALKAIKDNGELSVTDLHHETRITYAHLHTLKGLFIQKGWIEIFEEGVKHLLSITEKGKYVVEGINILLERLEITSQDLVNFRKRTKHGYKKETKEINEDDEEKLYQDATKRLEEKKVVKAYPGVKMVEPERGPPMEENVFKQEEPEIDEETMQEGVDIEHEEVTEENSFLVENENGEENQETHRES